MKTHQLWHNGFAVFACVLWLGGCKSDPKTGETPSETEAEPIRPTISVTTRSMEFIGPDTIPSGWNTFVYDNRSSEPHFILLDKYPEGVTIANTIAEVAPAFEEGMAQIMAGNNEAAMEAFGKLPEWFPQVVFSGGTGLISPGKKAVTTVHLEPGYYIMECYVRMPDGRFHTSMGMAKELIVRADPSTVSVPSPDVQIRISSTEGISWTGQPAPGTTVFSVTFDDQVVHENFVGHDVNLVLLAPGADVADLAQWINWATPTGLMSSSLPEGFTFLGGVNDAPEGRVQYFEADLVPGQYALISEVPGSMEKGLLKTFSIGQ